MPDRAAIHFEERLVERFRRGDRDALAGLFDLHVDRVYAYARHLTGSREDAEEIVSEAFLRALRHAAEYRGDSPFRGWLFGIARNLCMDRLRQPALLRLESIEPAELPRDPNRAALHADVRRAMESLPEEYREVLLLCDVEEWDHSEAAPIMGRSTAATKSLLYRARRALRDSLALLWSEN